MMARFARQKRRSAVERAASKQLNTDLISLVRMMMMVMRMTRMMMIRMVTVIMSRIFIIIIFDP